MKSKQTKKKEIYKYVLSVDFENGDGPDYFPIGQGTRWRTDYARVQAHFPEQLWAVFPPPKVEVLGLTKSEWRKACRAGRER